MATSLNNPAAWIEWMETLMGGASRQSYAATLPPERFYCVLDELPLHLIPRHARHWLQAVQGRPLELNSNCALCPAKELPGGISDSALVAGFATTGTIAWVRDPARGMMPFWLSPRLERVVREFKTSEPKADDLALLLAAGILIHGNENSFLRAAGDKRDQFSAKGYAPLHDLIHPFHVAALRRYYRYQIRNGAIQLGDRQSPRRYAAYNDPVARFFHHQLVGVLSWIAGEMLKPSYVYMASYVSGAELKKHTDRAQCEYSITLCFDFSPEPEGETSWPIRLDTSEGAIAVHQKLGDGLAYRGTQLPHYRDSLEDGKTSSSIFFHYVREDFDGPLR